MNERKRKETGSNLDSLHSRTPSCNRPNCEGEERKLRSCINWLNDNVRLMQKYIENLVFFGKENCSWNVYLVQYHESNQTSATRAALCRTILATPPGNVYGDLSRNTCLNANGKLV